MIAPVRFFASLATSMSKRCIPIRVKLLVILLICSIGPTVVAGVVGLQILRSSVHLLVSKRLQERAERISERLQSWLASLEDKTSIICRDEGVVLKCKQFLREPEQTQRFRRMRSSLMATLARLQSEEESISSASLASAETGRVVLSTRDRLVGLSLAGEPFFERAKRRGAALSSIVQPRQAESQADAPGPLICLARRVGSGDGSAILVLQIPVAFLDRLVLPGDGERGMDAFLVDQQGRMLTDGRASQYLRAQGVVRRGTAFELMAAVPLGAKASKLSTSSPAELTKAAGECIKGRSGFDIEGYRSYHGRLVVGAWKWIAPLGWGIVVEQNRSLLKGPLDDLQLFLVVLVIAVCALAVILSIYLSDRVTRPLSSLVIALHGFAQGDLSARVPVRSSDEIGMLARTFNHMASRLQRALSELGRKNREVRAANKELQDFLHIVSHDLRSPLVNIHGFADRLKRTAERAITVAETALASSDNGNGTKARESLGEIRKKTAESIRFIDSSVNKMSSMADALLALCRAGAEQGREEMVDLRREVEEIVAGFGYELRRRKIDVVIGPLPTLRCDRVRINQVFSNLISNAINYMGEGPKRSIRITGGETDSEFVFCVSDTGVGIADKDHERVFQVFTRLGQTNAPGQGVGLALIKRIITKRKGRIWVESEKGNGSRFFFTLPKPTNFAGDAGVASKRSHDV